MKTFVIGLTATLLLLGIRPLSAQIHNPQQRMVEMSGGLLDKGTLARTDNSGRWLRLAVGTYGKRQGVWQAGLLTHEKYYALPDSALTKVRQYLVEGTYTPALLRSAARSWYLNPTLGIVAGYESVDDRRVDPSGDFRFSTFLLGLTGGVTGEWNLSPRVAVLGYARVNYLAASHVQPFHGYCGIGLRFNFFAE